MGQNEQAMQASEKPVKEFAEGASRVKDAAARVSDQSMRAGMEMFQRNAETVQHTIQSSAKLASTMASGMVMTETMQRMCVECGDIARARIERGFERMGALARSRSPQDIVALQSEILRDNLETFLGFARKAGEHSTRLLEEAQRRVESLAKDRQAA